MTRANSTVGGVTARRGSNRVLAVNTPSPIVDAMRKTWSMTNALLGGTDEMRAANVEFLPMWPNEDPEDYTFRLSVSTLFPAYQRTVETLAARPFSKPITYKDDVPAVIKTWMEDVDLQGNNGHVFLADRFNKALGCGISGLLVDYPRRPPNAKTLADDKALKLRPYWVKVDAMQILGWLEEIIDGKKCLTQLRILELVEEQYGDYGTICYEQVRVLYRSRTQKSEDQLAAGESLVPDDQISEWAWFKLMRAPSTNAAGQKSTTWEEIDRGVFSNQKEIPFVAFFGKRKNFMIGEPPMKELAHQNVKHWQQESDQDNLMHAARVPILTISGVDAKFKLTIGSSGAVNLGSNVQAKMEYVEHTGAAISSGKIQLDDLKDAMRQSGAELLVLKPGPTTATEVASDNAVGLCALQEMAGTMEDGIDQALQFMANYNRIAQGGHAELFKDFGAATLAEASYQMLIGMATAGKLSGETLIDEGKRRGILNAEVTWDIEQERLALEGPPVGKVDPLTGLPYTDPVPPVPGGPPAPPPAKKPAKKKPAGA